MAFTIEGLQAGYEDNLILKNIATSIQKGKITTIIGPNGCGKSTLFKTIGRIVKVKQGVIKLYGEDMTRLKTKDIAKQVAILAQVNQAPEELTVGELVSYGRFPYRTNLKKLSKEDQVAIDEALALTNTAEFKNRSLQALSGGQRQRVWLAMALAQQTDILLLDEPTTYLDMAHQLEVLKIVKMLNEEKGSTIVMVLHDINQAARFSDYLIAMKSGEVVAEGDIQQMMTPEILKSVFAIEAHIVEDPYTKKPICLSYDI